MLFVPYSETNPKVEHEIAELVLFRFAQDKETIEEDRADVVGMLKISSDIDNKINYRIMTIIETHLIGRKWFDIF